MTVLTFEQASTIEHCHSYGDVEHREEEGGRGINCSN